MKFDLKSELAKVKEKLPPMPSFMAETVKDLREQGLLPVVAVLALAIPVAALVFSTSAGTYTPPPISAADASAQEGDSLVVVADRPGLRDHTDRFAGRTPRDPFRTFGNENFGDFVEAVTSTEPTGGGSATGGTGVSSPDTGVSDGGGSTTTGGGGSGSSPGSVPAIGGGSSADVVTVTRVETEYVFMHVQARLRFGQAGEGELKDLDRIPKLTGLPSRRPVAVYLGASAQYNVAIFSISPDITGMTGRGTCSSGTPRNCQFLILRPGQAVNMFDERRRIVWRLALQEIAVVDSELDLIEEIVTESEKGNEGKGPPKDRRGPDRRERPIGSN